MFPNVCGIPDVYAAADLLLFGMWAVGLLLGANPPVSLKICFKVFIFIFLIYE